jgi:orotidine-5'-phosphate decarboxylase
MDTSKVIVALDNYSPYMAREIIAKYSQQVYGFKMNHTLYPYIGKEYNNVFCDYKLYDIPSTVCNVIEHLIDCGAEMVTVNMNNNTAVFEAIEQYSDKIKLLGVTALTSWDHNDPNSIHRQEIGNMYDRTTWIMKKYNFWGMICSPKDLKLLKNVTKLKKICPGIRNADDGKQDQVRTATPEEAFENGADYLVMGRSFFKSI